jgi:RNA polymerase sigma-70 factor (sigma-E family)
MRWGDVADDGFNAFVREAQSRLVRYADLLTGDRGRAEDLVQHALVKTYLAWSRVMDGNPEAYARTVISHANTDWWRRRPWRETPTDSVPDRHDADHATDVVRRDVVMRALDRLTRRERSMVVLRFLYGMTEPEVAAELGCAVGTVKSGTARGLAKLRAVPELANERIGQHA